MTVKRALIATLVAALVGQLGFVAEAWAKDVDPVAATVNGHAIHLSDVEGARALLSPQLQDQPLQALYPMLLDSLINVHLAAEKAREQGFDEAPEYKKSMARIGDQMLERMLLTKHIEKNLDEELLQKRYDILRVRVETLFEIHARHILVKTEGEALDVVKKLRDGGNFADLAKVYSTGPSAPEGGDLGWFAPGRMVRAFEDAAMTVKPGTFTQTPVQTKFGWHIIKVEERRPLEVVSFNEARPALVNELSAELGQTLMKQLRGDAKVEKVDLQELK